jgi:hypothetical protein
MPSVNPNTGLIVQSGAGTTTSGAGISLIGGTASTMGVFFGDPDDGDIGSVNYTHSDNSLRFVTNATERMTINASGYVGIGVTTPSVPLHSYRTGSSYVAMVESNQTGASMLFASNGSSNNYHQGIGTGDGTDMRIFAGNSTRMVVNSSGDVGIGTATPNTRLNVYDGGTTTITAFRATSASYASDVNATQTVRAANSAFNFYTARSNIDGTPDTEFKVRGDGEVTADGNFTGGGADYAEYFEWADGNPNAEDRVGISVVLDGTKIRAAVVGEEPIGVISGNPSVVGDGDIDRWKQKYLRDDFGRYIWEDYDVLTWTEDDEEVSYNADNVPDDVVVPDDAQTVVQQRRKLNPAFDPDVEYISREDRPEWDTVGLMGKLRILKGQPTGSRWIKMRDVSATVEEWLIR